MFRFSRNAGWALLSVALVSFAPPMGALAQLRPVEITITTNAVKSIAADVESYIATLAAKCDKCDSSSKANAQKAVTALRRAVTDLEKTTSNVIAGIEKACKAAVK